MFLAALWESLAAAATTVIPPWTTRQIAWCSGSLLVRPQLWSSEPSFVTLMLTASKSGRLESAGSRWARIQSRPQMYQEIRPYPSSLRILTPQTRAPGATPTTPIALSIAPTVPATCVPCEFLSRQAVRSDVEQL
jgi:hypothetical protein